MNGEPVPPEPMREKGAPCGTDSGKEILPMVNHMELEGILLHPGEYRVTAAGRPVLHLELEHLSRHHTPEPSLQLEARIVVMAVGELAESNRFLSPGTLLRVAGRLNQKRWVRDGKVRWGRMELLAMTIHSRAASS
ncbi:MAG: hypothetical protein HQM02_12925 [Magnetococcales bacterium]|nr:hypothetical protein [Magnetococcales bacterium]